MMSPGVTSWLASLLLVFCAASRSLATSELDQPDFRSSIASGYEGYDTTDDDSPYKRSSAYGFGLGKRYPAYGFGLGKRGAPYSFGLGKRGGSSYGFGLGKRAPAYGFGLGKRQAYGFGLGKRAWGSWFDGPSRDVLKRPSYGFGLGKRSVSSTLANYDGDGDRQRLLRAAARMAEEDSSEDGADSPSDKHSSLRQENGDKQSTQQGDGFAVPL